MLIWDFKSMINGRIFHPKYDKFSPRINSRGTQKIQLAVSFFLLCVQSILKMPDEIKNVSLLEQLEIFLILKHFHHFFNTFGNYCFLLISYFSGKTT